MNIPAPSGPNIGSTIMPAPEIRTVGAAPRQPSLSEFHRRFSF